MYKNIRRIENDPNQDLHRYLALHESGLSRGAFLDFLDKAEKDDPENFQQASVRIDLSTGPMVYPVIFGEHAKKRTHQRLIWSPSKMLGKAVEMLEIPKIGRLLATHPVIWDYDANDAVADNEDGYCGVVVCNEREGFVVVYECGFNYILVCTIHNNPLSFIAKPHDKVVRIRKNAEVVIEN